MTMRAATHSRTLAEIVQRQAGVCRASVAADPGRDDQLTVFVLTERVGEPDASALGRAVAAAGGLEAVDVRFVFLNPLLAGRAAPTGEPPAVSDATALERLLQTVWALFLKRERVEMDDDILRLGAHSLHVIRVVSMLESLFGIDVPIHLILDHPVIRDQAAMLRARTDGAPLAAAAAAILHVVDAAATPQALA